ncbi:DNA polymerase IV [Blastomonas aquatica]|uniref:DNA polymerase IV n=1 Tax=Blastomonas aquatica TaxID=1510276 RepID=A0ABQ1JHL4_9SPHN|nr:DNA polymerase IV [Blastomonas aquatica]GGB68621.1 DNA polymerase IV 2 [Blastomonas aquatica]
MADPPDPQARKIIHIDMDAFYASVEQRDNPALRGLPVAVGGSSRRGVVAAASYEARTFGVRSAMPSVTALRRCPDLVFVKPRFDVYQQVSRQIREIFAQHTDLIEPLSLDEAYLDVSSNRQAIASATQIAQLIRADIRRVTGLTASAGVSYNKFIAKLASDQNKPDGLCVIRPEQGAAFVAALPVKRFHGVGPRTADKMASFGIVTGADLAEKSEQWLLTHFGSWGSYLHGAARGIDNRPVRADRIRKSIGGERTYGEDIWAESALRDALESIADIVWERVERNEAQGRTVTLKARYADFQTITRARSLGQPVKGRSAFGQIGQSLIDQILPLQNGIRLLGLTLSGLSHSEDEDEADIRQPELPFG